MKPFLFVRRQKHYARFFIPTIHRNHFKGQKFLVFSLGGGEGHGVRLKASNIENLLVEQFKQLREGTMDLDFDKLRRYELDVNRGIAKADGPEDHKMMMEALALLKSRPPVSASPEDVLDRWSQEQETHSTIPIERYTPVSSTSATAKNSLTLTELLNKYLLLKKLSPATIGALKLTVKEFSAFIKGKVYITDILVSDITRYQEYLAETRKNVPRTIDSKISHVKLLLNFAIKQGYLLGKNPAEGKSLMTKRQKLTEGYLIFEKEEIKSIYTSEYFNKEKQEDKDYYYTLLLGLITGCRASELTSLTKAQIKQSANGNNFIVIREAKTDAGKREIPIPKEIFEHGFSDFIKDKEDTDHIFRYIGRAGKGSGNAVGKKFSRHLQELKIIRGKLVFHSLRKFFNNFLKENEIEFEARCQVLGHEIESVNVATYSKVFSVDKLFELINPVQKQIVSLIELK